MGNLLRALLLFSFLLIALPAWGQCNPSTGTCIVLGTQTTGTVPDSQLGNAVLTTASATLGAHTYNFSAVTLLTLPISAGAMCSASGTACYDSTANLWRFGQNGSSLTLPQSATATSHQWLISYTAGTGAFTQGQPAFSDISGSATTGQMPTGVMYTNASFNYGAYTANFSGAAHTLPVVAVATASLPATCTFTAGSAMEMAVATDATAGQNLYFCTATNTWTQQLNTGGSVPGLNTQVIFNSSSALGASANLTWASPALTVGVAGSATGIIKYTGSTSGTLTTECLAACGTWTWKWPNSGGTMGYFLQTDGSGNTSWAAAPGGGTVTSIATTSPITGGTITTTGTIACATCAIGPGSSTANHIAQFSGTDGVTLKDLATTGSGNAVLATSPTLVTPALGTPTALVLTNATSLPCGALPALTGDTTTSATSCATTTGKVNGVSYPSGPSTNTVPVVTGSNTITYEAVPNAALANDYFSQYGTTCTLGTSCSPVQGIGINAQIGTSYTVPSNAAVTMITASNTGSQAYTGPTLSNNIAFDIFNINTGTVTYTPASGQCNGASNCVIPPGWLGMMRTDNTNTFAPLVPNVSAFPVTGAGQALGFNGTVFSAVTASGLSGLTTNTLLKAGSATSAINSGVSDNGVTVSTPEAISAGNGTIAVLTTVGANQDIDIGSGAGSNLLGGTGYVAFGGTTEPTRITSAGVISKYDALTTVGLGVPVMLGTLDQTGVSTANSGSAQNVLASTPSAGHYRLFYYVDQSAGCTTVGSGALTVSAGWTDATHARATSNQTLTPGTADTGTGSYLTQVVDLWSATTSAITVTATYVACTTGTWTYDIHATVEEVK